MYGGAQPWHPAMSFPGPTYFAELEREERQLHIQDKRNAEGFMKRRFAGPLREKGVKFVLDITRGNMDNWSIGEVVCNTAENLGASAVVMAPHGKGRVKVRYAKCAKTPKATDDDNFFLFPKKPVYGYMLTAAMALRGGVVRGERVQSLPAPQQDAAHRGASRLRNDRDDQENQREVNEVTRERVNPWVRWETTTCEKI